MKNQLIEKIVIFITVIGLLPILGTSSGLASPVAKFPLPELITLLNQWFIKNV